MQIHNQLIPLPIPSPADQAAKRRLLETVAILTDIQKLLYAVYRGDSLEVGRQHAALAQQGVEVRFLAATPAMRGGACDE